MEQNGNRKEIPQLTQKELLQLECHYKELPYVFGIVEILKDENEYPVDLQIRYANECALSLLEKDAQDLLSNTFFTLYPKGKKHWLQLCCQAGFEGKAVEVEEFSRYLGKYIKISSFQYAYGYAACILQDVTDFHVYQNALHGMVQAYREIYFVQLEENYFHTIYSDMEQLMEQGDYQKKVQQHILNSIIVAEEKERVQDFLSIENVKRVLREKGSSEYQYRRVLQDGTWEWCLASFTIAEERDGIPIAATLAVRSIDQVIKREEHTKQILLEVAEQAKGANQAKSRFLSNLSHDVRTPLNAIVGLTDIAMLHLHEPDKMKEYLEKIAVSGKHLLDLVNDVLDMSKIESGKLELQKDSFRLTELIDEVVTIIKAQAKEKEQTVQIDTSRIIEDSVRGDSMKLRQVLLNILGNAVKFTPQKGNISLKVYEKYSEKAKYGQYEFQIRDNGIGMAQDFLEHMFEPFAREEVEYTEKVEGTGLGLPIALSIVRMMGGDIRCFSAQGRGTKFKVTVYLEKSCKNQQKQLLTTRDGKEESQVLFYQRQMEKKDYSKKRILLVEDNKMNMEIVEEILRPTGAQLDKAYNGLEAVHILMESEPETYQLVLMDVKMPVMSGYEATEQIRGSGRDDLAILPIVAMTANAFLDDIRASEQAGMSDHLSKPIDMECFVSCMEKWLEGPSG